MKGQVRDEKVKFRVGYEYTVDGTKTTGEETEASWYLIDQQGRFYSYGPMEAIRRCTKADKLEFRLKIGDEYLTISDIEKRMR